MCCAWMWMLDAASSHRREFFLFKCDGRGLYIRWNLDVQRINEVYLCIICTIVYEEGRRREDGDHGALAFIGRLMHFKGNILPGLVFYVVINCDMCPALSSLNCELMEPRCEYRLIMSCIVKSIGNRDWLSCWFSSFFLKTIFLNE